MAGDWLKLELATPDKPEVFALASALNLDRDCVVGKLIRVWRWFDQHLENGHAASVTKIVLDEIAGCSGFAQQLVVVGWLREVEGGVRVPNFERHLGKGAKKRAVERDRQIRNRSRSERDESRTREEKRREEKKEKKKPEALALPDWVDGAAWTAWLEVRLKLKAPNTLRALQLQLNELARLRQYGQDPRAVLEQATARGWRGLFAVKQDQIAQSVQPPSARKCDYCTRDSSGSVGGIWHCDAHSLDAMDRKPREQNKGEF